jgi:hypothetical protein
MFYYSKILYDVESYVQFLNYVTHVSLDKPNIEVTGYGESGFDTYCNMNFSLPCPYWLHYPPSHISIGEQSGISSE